VVRAALADLAVPGDLAGDYQLDAATLVRIRTGERTLALQMTGRPPVRLQPFAKDRYADAQGTCEISFARDAHGAVSALLLNLGGADRSARRVIWTAPAPK
jgi:hypothetical protein